VTHVDLPSGIRSALGNLGLLAALVVAGAIYTSFGSGARELLVTDLFINIVLVVGLQIFVGNTGVLSFGHLAFATIGGYGMALLAIPVASKARVIPNAPWGLHDTTIPVMAATLVGIAVAIVVAMAVGVVIARAPGLAATMITLALLFVLEKVTENWTDLTNGGGRLSGVPGLESNVLPTAAAGVAVVIAAFYRATRSGRLAVAGREDELAAGAMGIDVRRQRYSAFVISAAVVALGGALQIRAVGSIGPSQFNFDVTILILAMLVVGGMHTVTGAIVGAAFITIGKEIARQLSDGALGLPAIDGLPDLFLAGSLLTVLVVVRRANGIMGDKDVGSLLPARSRPSPVAPRGASPSSETLVATGLGVVFGGFTALEDVSLSIASGQVHGLIGPNGAGKTTFVNLLTGVVPATTGQVRIGSTDIAGMPYQRARLGVSRTFQNLRVFGNLTVRENVESAALVAEQYRAHVSAPTIDELLDMSGLADVAARPARTLDYGNQRRLEIARAAALRPSFMVLDEPTSGMSESESLAMVQHVRTIAEAVGAGVLVIDHDLGFVTDLCDHITVLDRGRVLADGTPQEVMTHPAVVEAYLGSQAG
jgi:branched-chain amino acid transport system permease protein